MCSTWWNSGECLRDLTVLLTCSISIMYSQQRQCKKWVLPRGEAVMRGTSDLLTACKVHGWRCAMLRSWTFCLFFSMFVLHVICRALSDTAQWVGAHAELDVQPVWYRSCVNKLFMSRMQGCRQGWMVYTQAGTQFVGFGRQAYCQRFDLDYFLFGSSNLCLRQTDLKCQSNIWVAPKLGCTVCTAYYLKLTSVFDLPW